MVWIPKGKRTFISFSALLMASQGVDWEGVQSSVQQAERALAKQPSAVSIIKEEVDLDAHLQANYDRMVQNILQQQVAQHQAQLDKLIGDAIEAGWLESKRRFLEARQAALLVPSVKLPETTEAKRDLASLTANPKLQAMARQIRRLNEHRLRGEKMPFAQEMLSTLRSLLDSKEPVLDCWEALAIITSSSSFDYECEDEAWRKHLMAASCRFLSHQWTRWMDRQLAAHPRETLLLAGGKTRLPERVRMWCQLRLKRLSPAERERLELLEGGEPVWMELWSLARAGAWQAAGELAEKLLINRDPSFLGWFRSWTSSAPADDEADTLTLPSLPLTLQQQVASEYAQRLVKGGQDPYRMALLRLMGRCDSSSASNSVVVGTVEDWLWQQCMLVGGKEYPLRQLQEAVALSMGASHFDPSGTHPLRFTLALILTGQMELAIGHLMSNGMQMDAVHMAIAALNGGILRLLSDSIKTEADRLDYGQLMRPWIASVARLDYHEAIQYALCLSLSQDREYARMAQEQVRQLVLQSGDFAGLLGDVRGDGTRVPGLLVRLAPLLHLPPDGNEFYTAIVQQAAAKCEGEGRWREALQLYNLANCYDRVLGLLARQLASALIANRPEESLRSLLEQAKTILDWYLKSPMIAPRVPAGSQEVLKCCMCLAEAQLASQAGHLVAALQSLNQTGLLPNPEAGINECSLLADQLNARLSPLLAPLLPHLLLTYMDCLHRQYRQAIKTYPIPTQDVSQLRARSKSLMILIGLLRGPAAPNPEQCQRMTRMDIEIHSAY